MSFQEPKLIRTEPNPFCKELEPNYKKKFDKNANRTCQWHDICKFYVYSRMSMNDGAVWCALVVCARPRDGMFCILVRVDSKVFI